ncbi:LysM peptidoglycan-binding domain-containing protein [Pradoshia sp.]|uniref:LysM peptidoglycan-binding domain-containing protein n=1 Tax=Pradoshia sp. TaxID=2651281 RepID=UPI003F03F97A
MRKWLSGWLMGLAVLLAIPTENANALEPESSNLFRGIDVSEWQGEIDFREVADAGIEMVYIKSSEGTDYVDPDFERNYDGAKDAGLLVGFYHYVTARTESQAEAQARFFVSTISGKEFEGKLAMDFEDLTGLSNEEINDIALTFIRETVRLSGKEAVVYSDASNAASTFNDALTDYSLWIAEYGVSEPTDGVRWSSWAGWQYSDSGSVAGIDGDVDLDRFNDGILVSDTREVVKPAERETRSETITYTVKAGDTLSEIARKYHTTVAAIARENNLSNPDLIYAGEKLRLTIYDDDRQERAAVIIDYTVRTGDTLSAIARKYSTTAASIAKENNLSNPDLIYPGERLRITVRSGYETTTEYIVQRGDTLSELARRYGTTVEKIASDNQLSNPNVLYPGDTLRIKSDEGQQPPRKEYFQYIVKFGDTLTEIARRFRTAIRELERINNLTNPELIFPNQRIYVPRTS